MSKCFGDYRKYRSKREFGVEKTNVYQKESDRQKNESFFATFVTPEQYIEAKLEMLRDDMHIEPTVKELEHLREMKTEINIDIAVRGIIDRHWRTY
jgi:FPC/CPF motif-containing protein YcgG